VLAGGGGVLLLYLRLRRGLPAPPADDSPAPPSPGPPARQEPPALEGMLTGRGGGERRSYGTAA
jgi:hypothetical protein